MTTYKLDSAVERNEANPDTFRIPDEHDRSTLIEGEYAKLLFVFGDDGNERMWVQITQDLDDGTYVGTLANFPAGTSAIAYGDEVKFGPEHVAGIEPAND